MARFIDADKLIWQVQDGDKYGTIAKQVFISLLQNSETADVAPVIHAHWVPRNNPGFYYCSNCGGAAANIVEWAQKYCFHCGAKMDEAEIVGKRMLDGFIDGMGNNVKSVGQKFINNDKDTVEHTIMGMKNEVTHETG